MQPVRFNIEPLEFDKMGERTIHSPHPSHPKKLNDSLRNIDERIAQTTTESAPRGV
jgi:hypothetical protein